MSEMDMLSVGEVQWHCSDEDSGPDVGLLLQISPTQSLWVGEIPRQEWEEAGPEAAALGNDFGWWCVLHDGPLSRVVARFTSQEGAHALVDALGHSLATKNGER